MNQKNIFTAIAVILILQGLAFYFMGGKIIAGAFPNVDATGQLALTQLLEVVAVLSFNFGLMAYATRNAPATVGAWTLGFALLLCVTLKQLLVDGINVPIPAVAIQVLIVLAIGYLWLEQNKKSAAPVV